MYSAREHCAFIFIDEKNNYSTSATKHIRAYFYTQGGECVMIRAPVFNQF